MEQKDSQETYMDLGDHGVMNTKTSTLISDCGGHGPAFSWWKSTRPERLARGQYNVMAKSIVRGFASDCMAITDDFGDLVPVGAWS